MSKHKSKPEAGVLHPIATGWDDLIVICKKCSKKLSGGFGDDGGQPLRKVLRGALKETGKRGRVGVMEVPCFGVCPKRAVTVGIGSAPGEVLVVPAGFDTRVLVGRTKTKNDSSALHEDAKDNCSPRARL